MAYARVDQDSWLVARKHQIILFQSGREEKVIASVDMEECTVNSAYIKTLHYNPYEKDKHLLLLNIFHKDSQMHKHSLLTFDAKWNPQGNNETGYSQDSVFLGRSKLAKLKKPDSASLQVYDFEKQLHKQQQPLVLSGDRVFPGGLNRVIYQHDDCVVLLDLVTNKRLASLQVYSPLKQVVWNEKRTQAILLCKKTLLVVSKDLVKVNSATEKFNIKSATFSRGEQVVVYTTQCYLKYLLTDGDTGLLKCLDKRVYACSLDGTLLTLLDLQTQTLCQITLDLQELEFKANLISKNSMAIKNQLCQQALLGDSMIAHLYKKNYSALALRLIQDKKARFEMAIESGNVKIAFDLATELKDRSVFSQLA